jgi:hypothetical protein
MQTDPLKLRCPRCGAPISGVRAGQLTLASAMLRVEDDGSLSLRCPGARCSEVIPAPFLALTLPEPPPAPPQRRVRLAVRVDALRQPV